MQNSKLSKLTQLLKAHPIDRTTRINFLFLYLLFGLLSIGIWTRFPAINENEIKTVAVEGIEPVTGIKSFQDLILFPRRYEEKVYLYFPIRLEFTRLMNWTRINLFKQKYFPQVIVGNDGWLFYVSNNNVDDFQKVNLFNGQQISEIQKTIDDWGNFFEDQDIPLVILISPNKETIYGENLPAAVQPLGSKSRVDQILEEIDFPENIHVVDPRANLLKARQSKTVYDKTDTHWNDTGSCVAYSLMMKVIQEEISLASPLICEDIHLSRVKFSGDLSRLLFLENVINEETFARDPGFSRSKILHGYGDIWITSWMPDTTLPRIMVYRDSFLTKLIPLISENFEKADYFWTFQIDYERIARERPDLVIIQFAERNAKAALVDHR